MSHWQQSGAPPPGGRAPTGGRFPSSPKVEPPGSGHVPPAIWQKLQTWMFPRGTSKGNFPLTPQPRARGGAPGKNT